MTEFSSIMLLNIYAGKWLCDINYGVIISELQAGESTAGTLRTYPSGPAWHLMWGRGPCNRCSHSSPLPPEGVDGVKRASAGTLPPPMGSGKSAPLDFLSRSAWRGVFTSYLWSLSACPAAPSLEGPLCLLLVPCGTSASAVRASGVVVQWGRVWALTRVVEEV